MSEPHADALVFFGATGDLAFKKIFPALQAMARRGHLNVPVIGVARAGWTLDQLRARAKASVEAHGGRDPAAFELCGAEAGTCRFVRAELRDGQVLLEDPGGATPARVRYCWADSPVCNLYDAAGLPVGPFEIAIQ